MKFKQLLKRLTSFQKFYFGTLVFALIVMPIVGAAVGLFLPEPTIFQLDTSTVPDFGQAAKFTPLSPSSGPYIEVSPQGGSINLGNSFTIEGWYNPTADFDFIEDILSTVTPRAQSPALRIYRDSRFNSLFFVLSDENNNKYVIKDGPTTLTPDTWYHFAAVKDGNLMRLFINGAWNGTYVMETNPKPMNTFDIAAYKYYSSTTDFLNGQLDEIRISSTARYTKDFTPPSAPFTVDNQTIALYHLDGNAQDSSTNQHHGNTIGSVDFIPSTIPIPEPSPSPLPPSPSPTPKPSPLPASPTPIPSPPPSPIPSPSPTCDTRVEELSLSIPCNPLGFHYSEFLCSNGERLDITDYNVCREANDWYQLALDTCAQCPGPSPSPPLPSASPIASPLPSPSPSPIINNTPTISTSRLLMGRRTKRSKAYRQKVVGYDLDINDVLTLTLTNLPPGLNQNTCQQGITAYQGTQYRVISCDIIGTPTKSGRYTITASIKDNHGAESSKKLKLIILPF